MKVKVKNIIAYSLLWIAFIYHNSLLVANYQLVMNVISSTLIAFVIIKYKRVRDKSAMIFLGLLLFNIIIVRFINDGGVGITIWWHWAIQILAIVCAYRFDEKDFLNRFIRLVSFYAGVSIVCTILIKIAPSIWKSVMPTIYYSWMPFKGILPVHVAGTIGDKIRRNLSIFTEPGLYQMPLNTALYFLLIIPKKVTLPKKENQRCLLLILFAIITAQSTTGYLAMLAILAVFIIASGNRSKKQKVILVALLGIVILGFDSLLNGQTGILYRVIVRKLFDENGFSLQAGTGYWRIRTIEYVLAVVREHPFGAGYDIYNAYVKSRGGHLNELVGVECLKAFVYYGLPQMIGFYTYMIVKAYRNKVSLLQFALVIFLYINTTMAQSEIFYPSLVILFFVTSNLTEATNGNSISLAKKRIGATV